MSSEKSCLNEKKAAVIGQIGCTGSAVVIGWIPRLLLGLMVRTQTPRSAAWFGGENADPMLLREVTDPTSPLGTAWLPSNICLCLPPEGWFIVGVEGRGGVELEPCWTAGHQFT